MNRVRRLRERPAGRARLAGGFEARRFFMQAQDFVRRKREIGHGIAGGAAKLGRKGEEREETRQIPEPALDRGSGRA